MIGSCVGVKVAVCEGVIVSFSAGIVIVALGKFSVLVGSKVTFILFSVGTGVQDEITRNIRQKSKTTDNLTQVFIDIGYYPSYRCLSFCEVLHHYSIKNDYQIEGKHQIFFDPVKYNTLTRQFLVTQKI